MPEKHHNPITIPVGWQRISPPAEGAATCFSLQSQLMLSNGEVVEVSEQGFAIRYAGKVRAWLNRCPHAGSPLDWVEGQFFSESGEQLICHTHFARFDPLSGDCLAGPCPRGLYPLEIREQGDALIVPLFVKAPD